MIEFYAFINETSTFRCFVNVIQIYISSKLAQIIQRGKLFKSIQVQGLYSTVKSNQFTI